MTATNDAIRKAQAEYRREWRKRNPEKEKAAQERYWAKKAKELQLRKDDEKSESPYREDATPILQNAD